MHYIDKSANKHEMLLLITVISFYFSLEYSHVEGSVFTSLYKTKENECEDKWIQWYCRKLQHHRSCEKNPVQMREKCAFTCGFCGNYKDQCRSSTFGCCKDGSSKAQGSDYAGCREKYCRDTNSQQYCELIRAAGFCSNRLSTSYKGCIKTCGLCRKCKDTRPKDCKEMITKNICRKSPQTSAKYCRESCHLCGVSDPCHGYRCAHGTRCDVDANGRPFCNCHVKCDKADHKTGIVCGRDNTEYINLCQLKKSACVKKWKVTVKNYGKCTKNSIDQQGKDSKKLASLCGKVVDAKFCRALVETSKQICDEDRSFMIGNCPHKCGFCGNGRAPSPPINPCINSIYGCCIDGKTEAKGPASEGCPDQCEDKSVWFCKNFVAACGIEKSRASMMQFCPASCNYCMITFSK